MSQRNRTRSRPTSSGVGTIRIIGGSWRGRKLPVLTAEGLRPTTDRVKETVFNWLQFEIPGKRVLDAFAGTGSLGLEALSRGAASSVFIENNALAAKQLADNLNMLKTAEGEVQNTDAISFLKQPANQQFDLVFLDPPFHQNLLESTLESLVVNGWLSENAWVYVETEKKAEFKIPDALSLHREKIAGQAHAHLFTLEN